jgi:predicted membrane-bound spermidine synthase
LYALFYGIAEVADVGTLWVPASRWQVPPAFVTKRSSHRVLVVWGGLLGPGFATRNPYAGFTALLLAIAAFGSIKIGAAVALTVGIAHGTARALALLRDARNISQLDYLQSVLRSLYWRRFDGLMLLLLGGMSLAGFVAR